MWICVHFEMQRNVGVTVPKSTERKCRNGSVVVIIHTSSPIPPSVLSTTQHCCTNFIVKDVKIEGWGYLHSHCMPACTLPSRHLHHFQYVD